MKPFRLAAFAILLAACTTSPTDPARLDSAAPSLDEGPGFLGSGNNADDGGNGSSTTEQGGNTLGSGNATNDSTSTERGGNMLGSGN